MRTFLNGSGADVTASVSAHLAAHRELLFADLYVIRTAPCYAGHYLDKTFLLTDYASPLVWSHKGTFQPAIIARGEVESRIGLEAATLDLTWSPRDADVLATAEDDSVLLTALQGFSYGVFDEGAIEVWRCLMPQPGDADTFGACLLFAGSIGDQQPDRLAAKLTAASRLEHLNRQVPANVLEPGNLLAQYSAGTRPPNGPSTFAITSGATRTKLYANPGSAPGYVAKNGTYDSGFLRFTSGRLAGHFAKLYAQTIESGHHAFYLESLPFLPQVGDALGAFIPVPPDFAGAGGSYQGFPYVPQPQNSSVVIA